MELISADVCRDGGSLAVDFRRADGTLLSMLLEVLEIPRPGEKRRFGHLHVGPTVQNACDPSTIVARGSAEEAELVAAFDQWARSAPVAPPSDPAGERQMKYTEEFRSLLMSREG